nr:AAA family ATPase [Candidatus Levybacteria bacterium]
MVKFLYARIILVALGDSDLTADNPYMEYVADLHLHSKYSRAVSPAMNLQNMALWASKKGLDILSASDWTHPLWFREITAELEEAEQGLFKLSAKGGSASGGKSQNQQSAIRFLLSVEVSSIYTQGGKVRRIHNLIWAPSFETCEKISTELRNRGCNLNSDGRPIIGLSSIALAELVFSIDKNAMIIPCHAWTPWFSLYGSNSGFDSIDECFGEYAKYIYGVETGLSSDPYMNWQIKELETRSILSFSDAHSMAKMGREATVFELQKLTFDNIKKA